MKSNFNWTLSDGRQAGIKARYSCSVENKVLNADGYKWESGKEVVTVCEIRAYVEGKQVGMCFDSGLRLVDTKTPGIKKIDGLNVGFNLDIAEKYEAWVAELIENGTTEEAKTFQNKTEEKIKENEVAAAKVIVKKAESQKEIPTVSERKAMLSQYNSLYNEGAEGYLPEVISMEEYQAALMILRKYSV